MRLTFLIIFTFLRLNSILAQTETNKLEITHLTENFYIYTTYSSFKGVLYPANGMYVLTDSGALIFDTPWDSIQFQPLLDSIAIKHRMKAIFCLATHSHEDRTAGLEYFKNKGIKTYTTFKTDSISLKNNEKRAQFLIEKDTTFSIGGIEFETFYAGHGHTSDNIVIWFNTPDILYGGCLVKSIEAKDMGNLADANLEQWFLSIKRLENKYKSPAFIIPGHKGWQSKKALKYTLKLIKTEQKALHKKKQ